MMSGILLVKLSKYLVMTQFFWNEYNFIVVITLAQSASYKFQLIKSQAVKSR